MENDFYENFMNDPAIKNRFNETYFNIYKKYLRLKFDFQNLVAQKKKILKPVSVPSRTFYTTYMLLPPFEVIEHVHPGNTYYSQKRHV